MVDGFGLWVWFMGLVDSQFTFIQFQQKKDSNEQDIYLCLSFILFIFIIDRDIY